MAGNVQTFAAVDYVVFALMLLVSAGIGIFYACRGGRQKTTGEFLMGNRNMQVLPVAISILLSFMSAILVLGTSAEMYTQGTEYYLYMFGISLGVLTAALIFVPLLFPLKLTSAYEYLELRFESKAARMTGTVIMIVQQVLYMGVASYAPSTALEAVTGFPTWATVITIGLVSTFYTTLGGMSAVIWTDVFQGAVLLAGLLAILIMGSLNVGGINEVWRINDEWDRIRFFNFSPDPTIRHTFWSLVIGGMITWMSIYGVNQPAVQRYCALPSLSKARTSVLLNMIGVVILLTIVCLVGITVFAYYATQGCDPLSAKYISNSNQLIPYFVMDVLGYPGLPGLFLSCLFSGALSTMSSSLNSLSAICWEDFLKSRLHDKLTEGQRTLVTKFLVLVFGAAGIGTGFMAQNLGGTVLQASLSFVGGSGGPVLGLFILGAFFPWANWIGAVVGGISGLAMVLWIGVGAYTVPPQRLQLDYPTSTCWLNDTLNTTSTSTMMTSTTIVTTTTLPEYSGISALYTVSYLWFPAIGVAVVVVVGLLVSVLTGMSHIGDVDTKYLIPVFDRLFPCLPASISRPLKCYQEFEDPEVINAEEKDVEIVVFHTGGKSVNSNIYNAPVLGVKFVKKDDVNGVDNGSFITTPE